METKLLQDTEIFPSREVLQNALDKVYNVLDELESQLTQPEYALTFHWKYYKDGKAWLCKMAHKMKTIFWLSVWEEYFKTSFFFLERHLEGIVASDIDKKSFIMDNEWGKMIPVIFNINKKKQLPELLQMVKYKKTAK